MILSDASAQLCDEKRAREHLWRQRSAKKLARMRAEVKAIEQVALALPLLQDDDAIWDEFLDRDTKHMRQLLRRLSPVASELKALRAEQTQLRHLLSEHELASRALRTLLNETKEKNAGDAWDLDVQRWRALARIHFKPWTDAQCMAELDAALQETYRFTFAQKKYTTGLNFLGWEDSLQVQQNSSVLQFSLHKTYKAYDLDHHLAMIARIFNDTELYTKVFVGGRARTSVDVLQQVAPHVAIAMYHERYHSSEDTVHMLNLIARVETEDSVTEYLRRIDPKGLTQAFTGATDSWIHKFNWMRFDLLDTKQPRSACDYRVTVRGTVEGLDPTQTRFWLFELLGSLVRIEAMVAKREFLVF